MISKTKLVGVLLLLSLLNSVSLFVQAEQSTGTSSFRQNNRFLQLDNSNDTLGNGQNDISNIIDSLGNFTNSSDDSQGNDANGSNQASGSGSALPANTSSQIKWSILDQKIKDSYANIFYQDLRLEGHIITDKVVYRPNDVIFIEVLVVDAFNKSLVNLDRLAEYYYQLMFNLEIQDGLDNKIYSSSVDIQNSTVSFTYKVPQDVNGGQYKIVVYNQNMPQADRLISIRNYNRETLLVQATFDKESYSPGDTVNGVVQVNRTDGIQFSDSDTLSFSLTVNFGVSSFNISDESISSKDGSGTFSFDIPSKTTQLVDTVAFTVMYNQIQQIVTQTIIVGQPEDIVIDFATETNLFVYNVPNKIYFQAFTGQDRSQIVDFSDASLKSEVLLPPSYFDYSTFSTANYYQLPPSDLNMTDQVIMDANISTEHRGKGLFVFTPQPFMHYYLELSLGSKKTSIIDLPFYSQYPYPIPVDPWPMVSDTNGGIAVDGGIGIGGPAIDVAPINMPVVLQAPENNGSVVGGPAVDVPAVDVPAVDVPAVDVPAVEEKPAVQIVPVHSYIKLKKQQPLPLIQVVPTVVSNDSTGAPVKNVSSEDVTSTYIPIQDQQYISFPIYSNPNEVSFTITNDDKILENDEDLELQFMTNQILNYQNTYLVAIQLKEKIVYAQIINFAKNNNYKLTVPASAFAAINGGVMQVSLYQLNSGIYPLFDSTKLQNMFASSDFNLNLIAPLFYDKGEILFFKKPSKFLDVQIETDKDSYAPGDQVNFNVVVTDQQTGQSAIVNDDVFLSLYVTDESVFDQIKLSQIPGSLPALVYLENEVDKSYSQFFLYANEYINHLYTENDDSSSDRNLELLLGVQSWRFGYFFYPNIVDLQNQIYSLAKDNETIIEQLFSYPFMPNYNGNFDNGGIGIALGGIDMNGAFEGMAFDGIVNNFGGPQGAVPPQPLEAMAASAALPSPAPTPVSPSSPLEQSSESSESSGQQQQGQNEITFAGNSLLSDFMTNITVNAREYSHQLRQNYSAGNSMDMTETLFYQSAVQLSAASKSNQQAKYSGSFYLSDLITKFRITANAFSSSGVFGFNTFDIQTIQDFYIQVTLPPSMVVGDEISININIFNNLKTSISAPLSIIGEENVLEVVNPSNQQLTIGAGSSFVKTIKLSALQRFDNHPIVFSISGKDGDGVLRSTSITKFVNIVPKGFPLSKSQGGFIGAGLGLKNVSKKADFVMTIPESVESGSISFSGKVFSSNFATLTEAIAALIKTPSGCFEQISATTYPLVMGLNFLAAQPNQSDAVQSLIGQSKSTLQDGYTQLTNYKTTELGYEWFGASPASEVLTAYGYMQFLEMQQNTDFVDQSMLQSAISWLMSRVDTSGGFQLNPLALDSFGRAPKNVTDAYIVWALTSGNETIDGLNDQITYLVQQADDTIDQNNIDTYYLSLVAGILYNVGRTNDARKYADIVAEFQQATGRVTNSFFTITMSEGVNLNIETSALAIITWLNDQDRYSQEIELGIDYIVSLVQLGSYGTTQATVLSLKAITKYMNNFVEINGDGDFVLSVNGVEVQRVSFTPEKKDAISFDISDYINQHIDDIFFPGNDVNFSISIDNYTQDVTIENQFANDQTLGFKLSYSMDVQYYDQRPPSGNASIDFSVALQNNNSLGDASEIGQLFTYDLTITNLRANRGLLMVVAIFRIPACLEVNFQMLDDLKNNQLIDQYEVRNGNTDIAIYWRQFEAGEVKNVKLDFVQAFSGTCYQQPSDAYVYYNNDQPIYWIYY